MCLHVLRWRIVSHGPRVMLCAIIYYYSWKLASRREVALKSCCPDSRTGTETYPRWQKYRYGKLPCPRRQLEIDPHSNPSPRERLMPGTSARWASRYASKTRCHRPPTMHQACQRRPRNEAAVDGRQHRRRQGDSPGGSPCHGIRI